MKGVSHLRVIIAISICQLSAFADDLITNVMSPVVSCQYEEVVGETGNSTIASPVASYVYSDELSENTNSLLFSQIASYQYFDVLDASSVQFLKSQLIHYNYQFSSVPGVVTLHGSVTDTNGFPINNASVTLWFGSFKMFQTKTDAQGYYLITTNSGNFSLKVEDPQYQTQLRGLTLNANTAEQDFQLIPTPQLPSLSQVFRSQPVNYTIGDLMGSQLRIFNGSEFVPINVTNLPSTNLMTIVMTHGWIPGLADANVTNTAFDRWPVEMASDLQIQNITPFTANILAWDWRYAATYWEPGIPSDRTLDQSVALGEALQHYLGAGYSQPFHFLGHSLGTLLNAAAINYLHGDTLGFGVPDASPWTTNIVQVTLFDQAQLAQYVGFQITYQSALPSSFTWADNYKSFVGFGDFDNAVNVNLQKGAFEAIASISPLSILSDSHSYPVDWYESSILAPLDAYNPLGFKLSYEYAPQMLPPSDIQTGSIYEQIPANNDELALEPVPSGVPPLLIPEEILQTTEDTVDYTTGVAIQTIDTAENATDSLFDYASSAAVQGEQAVVNYINSSSSLALALTTTAEIVIPLAKNGLPHPLDLTGDGSTSNLPPMAWLPIAFPGNATEMAFDFMEIGNPMNDELVCAVGTNDLFSIEALHIPTNAFSASRLIDVSAWAGTTNELFFGFLGGTSSNATIKIQNIRFYSTQAPHLNIAKAGDGNFISWPNSAGGYVLVSTTNLAASSWEVVTNVPEVSGDQYVLTNSWPEQMRFFTLLQQ